jgi:NTE family protein
MDTLDRPKVGLALGGGIARGLAHIGVLQVLEDNKIPVDIVAGTSSGSLVGAMYAAGLSVDQMAQEARKLVWSNLVKLRLRRDGLLDSDGLNRFFQALVGDLEFSRLRLPFAAVAVDVTTGEEVAIREGKVATAVRASCAVPGVFLPVRMNGRVLVDGGVRNNVPVSVARAMGADLVIAVELGRQTRPQAPPRNVLDIIMYSIAIMAQDQIGKALALADLAIRPNLETLGAVDLHRADEFIEAGRLAAEEALPELLAKLSTGEKAS